MQTDEVIEMARQAGLIVNSPYLMPHDHVMRGIEAFAKLVAAKERELCARIADQSICAAQASNEIRARGEK